MPGKAIMMSTTRITSRSVQPPMTPHARPTTTPAVSATATAPSPVSRDSRAPVMARLRMSRPYWSVPNGCVSDGGDSASAGLTLMGS